MVVVGDRDVWTKSNGVDQVGTHADSLVAEAVIKGFTNIDLETAYAAVYKDATVPPINDANTT